MINKKQLKALKVGDILTLNINDGFDLVISNVEHNCKYSPNKVFVWFVNDSMPHTYNYDHHGKSLVADEDTLPLTSILDIIAIKKGEK